MQTNALPDPELTPPPGDPEPTPPEPVDAPPFVSAGLGATGDEGAAIRLDGSADDDHGEPAVSWSYRAESGVDSGAACTFASPASADTTFSCTDDGTYRVTLTARDGVNAPVSASATVKVANVAPSVNLAAPAAWQVVRAGTEVGLTAPIADPGSNDTHTCTVAWDDSRIDSFTAGDGACRRTHTFADAGM